MCMLNSGLGLSGSGVNRLVRYIETTEHEINYNSFLE